MQRPKIGQQKDLSNKFSQNCNYDKQSVGKIPPFVRRLTEEIFGGFRTSIGCWVVCGRNPLCVTWTSSAGGLVVFFCFFERQILEVLSFATDFGGRKIMWSFFCSSSVSCWTRFEIHPLSWKAPGVQVRRGTNKIPERPEKSWIFCFVVSLQIWTSPRFHDTVNTWNVSYIFQYLREHGDHGWSTYPPNVPPPLQKDKGWRKYG